MSDALALKIGHMAAKHMKKVDDPAIAGGWNTFELSDFVLEVSALLASSQGRNACIGCVRDGFQDAEPTCHECTRFDEPVPEYASDFFEAHPQPSGLREADI